MKERSKFKRIAVYISTFSTYALSIGLLGAYAMVKKDLADDADISEGFLGIFV